MTGEKIGSEEVFTGEKTGSEEAFTNERSLEETKESVNTAAGLLRLIRSRLMEAGIEEAVTESWIFLEWICGISREMYFMDPEMAVPEDKVRELTGVVRQRRKRIPLQHLMGTCEFMGFPFYVNEHVLIPRQDTECLVEQAVKLLEKIPVEEERPAEAADNHGVSGLTVLDLCTGSGCIGISIKKMVPEARVTLSDISGEALAVAGKNADSLHAETEIIQGDLFENIRDSYHMIVSNPPYIPSEEIGNLMPEVRDHEPRLALDGDKDGLAFYRRIAHEAKEHLHSGGWLLLEIGSDQGPDLTRMLNAERYHNIEIIKDLAGLDRIAAGRI